MVAAAAAPTPTPTTITIITTKTSVLREGGIVIELSKGTMHQMIGEVFHRGQGPGLAPKNTADSSVKQSNDNNGYKNNNESGKNDVDSIMRSWYVTVTKLNVS
ncbi:hypothetical protein NUW58_g3095 [Xylaria curta]|uniref:Uncharacterized protein n=1 Tax=Xylaria curta TaxID=42375 RepID=A0ACC1PDH1_9PEZI|nr:hypothetical protein NUW58_g3095 [Xylaria curta]